MYGLYQRIKLDRVSFFNKLQRNKTLLDWLNILDNIFPSTVIIVSGK